MTVSAEAPGTPDSAFDPDTATIEDDPRSVRQANALFKEAALLRDQGRPSASLAVYDRLQSTNARVPNDTATEVISRQARLMLLADLGTRHVALKLPCLGRSCGRQAAGEAENDESRMT